MLRAPWGSTRAAPSSRAAKWSALSLARWSTSRFRKAASPASDTSTHIGSGEDLGVVVVVSVSTTCTAGSGGNPMASPPKSLRTAERRDVEVAPGGPHRLVAAAVDEVCSEHPLAVAEEHVVAVPFIDAEVRPDVRGFSHILSQGWLLQIQRNDGNAGRCVPGRDNRLGSWCENRRVEPVCATRSPAESQAIAASLKLAKRYSIARSFCPPRPPFERDPVGTRQADVVFASAVTGLRKPTSGIIYLHKRGSSSK